MSGAVVSFLVMAVAVRELSFHMGAFEIMFFRSALALVILAPFAYAARHELMKARLGLQFMRNIAHFIGQYCWVLAISLIPLAQAIAIEFTTPIWVAFLAALVLGEKLTGPRWIAAIGGFIGVMFVVRPGVVDFNPDSLFALGAALGFACSVIMVKILTRTDSPFDVVFWMTVIQLPMGLIPAAFYWTAPVVADTPWLIAMAITGMSAHYCMAAALKAADASIVLPIDFLRIPLIAVIGFILYSEALDPWVLVGAAIIFAVNYYAVARETRR